MSGASQPHKHIQLIPLEDGADAPPRPLKEAQVARLREAEARLTRQDCPYAVGALVTPRADGMYRHAGEPHLAVAVRVDPGHNFAVADSSGPDYGARHDLRVASVKDSGAVVMHWVDSAYFDPYTGD